MSTFDFENNMKELTLKLEKYITDKNGDSILKGFVDSRGNLYPLTLDTKVLSKVVEFVFIPMINCFCKEKNYTLIEPPAQNYYPDLTIIDNLTKEKYAIDIKTTYRISEKEFIFDKQKYIFKQKRNTYQTFIKEADGSCTLNSKGDIVDHYLVIEDPFTQKVQETYNNLNKKIPVNGMTLGAYTGYFKNRLSTKNIVFPYSEYKKHYILGMIYSRDENEETKMERIENYKNIQSPIYNIKMFFVEKYQIATKQTGSGNTKNIGSVKTEYFLINGIGEFQSVEEFDNYWLNKK